MASCIAPGCDDPAITARRFCTTHIVAPVDLRRRWSGMVTGGAGGRSSRDKRRAELARPVIVSPSSSPAEIYDASNVAPRLWVGAKPPADRTYPGIDAIVLCAAEYQPPKLPFFDKLLYRCPLPDDALSNAELSRALMASQFVAKQLRDGKRVLVTCQQGINRSAFVAALALGYVTTRATADELVTLMRERRNPKCLYNRHFREYLAKFVAAAGRPTLPR